MSVKNIKAGLVASAAVFALGTANAETQTNQMTNIVTIVPSCDFMAIGIDFGIHPGSIVAAISSSTANTTQGNAVTGNTAHPSAAEDTPGAGDDEIVLDTGGLGGVVISAAIAADHLAGQLAAGVYVVCTKTPTSIVVDGVTADATLPTAAGASTTDGFASTLVADAGGPLGTETGPINYTTSFAGLVVSTPESLGSAGVLSIFDGKYTATGEITAGQTAGAGYYHDEVTVTLTF